MDAIYLVFPALIVLAVVIMVLVRAGHRKQTARVRAELQEFARQVGGVEHTAPGQAPLKFGIFPDAHLDPGEPPFDYAIEFTRGTFDVLAFEKEHRKPSVGGTRRQRGHRCQVQLRVPQTPMLWIGPEVFAVQDLELRAQLITGLPGEGHHFVVASQDEAFARAAVTPEVAGWVSARLPRWFMPIVLEQGVVRTKPLGERLVPKHIMTATDQLMELVQLLPRDVWSCGHA